MVIKEGVHSYLATLGGNITTSSWKDQVIHSLLPDLNIFLTFHNFSNFFFLEIGIIQGRINQSNGVNDTTGIYLHMLYIFHFHKYWIQKKKKIQWSREGRMTNPMSQVRKLTFKEVKWLGIEIGGRVKTIM